MAKIIASSLIVRDDFNNVLILKKKVKRGQEEVWSILTQKIRGKETSEKCIHKGVKDILKSIVFDLESFKEYEINNEESIMTFVGTLKEKVTLDKNYKESKWISKRQINDFILSDFDKKVLEDYFR